MKKIILSLIVFFCIIAIVVISLNKTDAYGKEPYKDSDSIEKKIVKLTVFTSQMQNELGDNSLYPYYYRSLKTKEINGMAEKQAIDKTNEEITERYALYTKAKKAGITVSEKEKQQHIDDILKEFQKSDDFDRLNSEYKKYGTSFAAQYKNNNIWNSFEATIKKWGDTNFNDSSAVDYLKKNVNKIVESFKKSAKYEDLSKVLNSCEKAYNSFGSNTSKIKKQFETDLSL